MTARHNLPAALAFRPKNRSRLAGRLSISLLATSNVLASPAAAQEQVYLQLSSTSSAVGDYAAELDTAARQFGLSPDWLRAIMHAESGSNPLARSRKGAIGLMQLLPGTYADMRQVLGLGPDPWRPADNILAGAGYLRRLIDRYGATGAVAAYNAGPGRYEGWISGARSLPAETRTYVARVRSLVEGIAQGAAAPKPARVRVTPQVAPLFIAPTSASLQAGDTQVAPVSTKVRPTSLDMQHRTRARSDLNESGLFVPIQTSVAQP